MLSKLGFWHNICTKNLFLLRFQLQFFLSIPNGCSIPWPLLTQTHSGKFVHGEGSPSCGCCPSDMQCVLDSVKRSLIRLLNLAGCIKEGRGVCICSMITWCMTAWSPHDWNFCNFEIILVCLLFFSLKTTLLQCTHK